MKLDFIKEFYNFAKSLPEGSPPVMVGHPLVGQIGVCIPGREFRLQGMSSRSFEALMKDEITARKAMWLATKERGSITTWDGVLNARANGLGEDALFFKASQTTVANNWSCFYRSTGVPGAGSYANIPGGAAHNVNSVGAFPLKNPTGTNTKYLLNFGVNHLTGANVVLLVDLLVAAGNINANTTSAQTVNTTALTRYTDGVGVMMTLEVTTALGSTASNVTISYTNSSGTSGRSTGSLAMTASAAVYRLQPTAGGALIPLQTGDIGVKSVETITFSAAMGGGVVALLLYKPLLLVPTLASTTFVERSTPNMLGGIVPLATDASGNLGCLTVFVLSSTTSTGTQTYFLQTCEG
jgi:hypothetical protein